MCPNLERVVRSSRVMVQKGHGQLVDVLLIGWWLINPWFQLYWGLCAYGQHIFNVSHLMRVSISAKQLQDIVRYIP